MANIKSAKKRILVTETKTAKNKAIKSGVKTAIKKVEAASNDEMGKITGGMGAMGGMMGMPGLF